MVQIDVLLKKLGEKYGRPRSLTEYLSEKYEVGDNGADTCNEKAEHGTILFKYDAEYNRNSLKQLMASFDAMQPDFFQYTDENDSAKIKVVEKYRDDLEKLTEYKKLADGEKLAGKFKNTLTNTIMKLWEFDGYNKVLQKYFKKNGIRLESYVPGHKMSDDELAMLHPELTNGYWEKTEDSARRYEVIEMLRPIVYITYLEDDEPEDVAIPGVCRFYA